MPVVALNRPTPTTRRRHYTQSASHFLRSLPRKTIRMIDFLAYIYDVEDMNDLDWDEEEKLVDLNWPMRSGFKAKAEADGLQIEWAHPDRLASRELGGYWPVYELDRFRQIRRKLVLSDGSVLVGKRQHG
jgi:hypothetical protein